MCTREILFCDTHLQREEMSSEFVCVGVCRGAVILTTQTVRRVVERYLARARARVCVRVCVCVHVLYVCDCGIAGLEQRDGVLSDKERKKLHKHYKSLAKKLRGHSDLLGVAGVCVRAYVYVYA